MYVIVSLTFILGVSASVFAANACSDNLLVNISNGHRLSDGKIEHEGVVYSEANQIELEGYAYGCVCNIWSCVRKCCPEGFAVINGTCQKNDAVFILNVYNYTEQINATDLIRVVYNRNCDKKLKFVLSPLTEEVDAFYVQQNGFLYLPLFTEGRTVYYPEEYCLDTFVFGDDGESDFCAVVCTDDKYRFTHGMIISMPFLLLTFLVYAILPDRNLHGKCLMCYVITLFGAYALLIFIQLYPNSIEMDACKALGIMCLFFFMVSFFWMSVMSIDIFLAFSGRRGFSGSRKEAERKRFLLYSAYAWGMPLLLVVVVTSLSVTTDVEANTWYNPGMGAGQCWLRDGIPTLLYFYLPMALLIIINILLFCTTACKIKQVKQDTAVLRKDESKKHSYENDKQRFNLYLKLLLAMGVNWSMEIISWIVDWQIGHVPPAVWYITDFCNALYGVFVFFIFVFKRNIWKLLKKRLVLTELVFNDSQMFFYRYYMTIGKPIMARNLTSAYSPRTTASSLNHTITTDKNFANDSSVLTSEVA
ncbi:hypothetical protein RN001_014581 [Aquatica leii]|uniref:G-protein coupled receptors family 2 profile 2 domain-containing protein n=1 Tax=Aquatica leii TaxID=1421715 RepID=A0AAN7SBI5_9COLE|nr:hypothetical protein RN001_014581 [Aquatica leii]